MDKRSALRQRSVQPAPGMPALRRGGGIVPMAREISVSAVVPA